MRARRWVQGKYLSLSFLPTHLMVGASVNTVVVPSPGRPITVRFIHLHVPFFYVTFSWRLKQ